jgi:hypothetical protein
MIPPIGNGEDCYFRMRYLALATDYDGTLATDGQMRPTTCCH